MKKMPALFIGHGSPMNAIEENQFTQQWKAMANKIPKPKAILAISAHWFTDQTRVMTSPNPRMIYDMYGFPEELYKIVYNAEGAPHLAQKVKSLIGKEVIEDDTWGYDHGTWSVLHRMYPEADIPVFQLSIDQKASLQQQYKMGQELAKLREESVLIFGSGNVVHNLARINWNLENQGYPWAYEFDNYISENILARKDEKVIHYQEAGSCADLSFTSLDHFAPLLYVLGAAGESDKMTVFNQSCILGSLSMTSYLFE